MSEKLIKRLREQADRCFDGSKSAKLMQEAADALESRPTTVAASQQRVRELEESK